MSHRLRYREHDLELPEGRFVIGRSAQCQLSLDDPLVSRQHALLVVDGGNVTVEDLGSRNGVLVNDQKIDGRAPLSDGDRIKIGSQEMSLIPAAISAQPGARGRAAAPTARLPALGVLGALAEKALALGHGEEAERIVGGMLSDVLERAHGGYDPGPEAVTKTCGFAVKLALQTGKGSWVDFAVRLHHVLGRPMPAALVDELHDVLRKTTPIDLGLFRNYLAGLKARASELGPQERFQLSRLEGLERMAASR